MSTFFWMVTLEAFVAHLHHRTGAKRCGDVLMTMFCSAHQRNRNRLEDLLSQFILEFHHLPK